MASKKKKDAKASTAKLLLDSARKRRQSRAIRRTKASEQHHKNLNNSILAVAEAFLQAPRQEPEVVADLPPTTREGFPQFMQLPAEVRTMIWEFTLPGPRIFEPSIDEELYQCEKLRFLTTFPPPSIRAVCKEAWLFTESHGKFICALSPKKGRENGYWFNNDRDILYFSHHIFALQDFEFPKYLFEDLEYMETEYETTMEMMAARHVAFRWECMLTASDSISKILRGIETIERVWFVNDGDFRVAWNVRPTPYTLLGTDTRLGAFKNYDGLGTRTWGELKESVLVKFQKRGQLLDRARHVELCGMEVLRREGH